MTGSGHPALLDNYTSAADIAVIAVCFVIVILMFSSYIRKTPGYRLFRVIVGVLIGTAMASIFYNTVLAKQGPDLSACLLHWLLHSGLLVLFTLFIFYIAEVANLDTLAKTRIRIAALCGALLFFAADGVVHIAGLPSGQRDAQTIAYSNQLFVIAYILFSLSSVLLMRLVQRRLYRRVMLGFYGSVAFSFVIMGTQRLYGSHSFTCLTFLFPVVAMFYILHANPYDAETGTIDGTAMNDVIRYFYLRKKPFLYLSLFLPGMEAEETDFPESVRSLIRQSALFFRSSLMFHVGKGHMIMIFPKRWNSDFEHRISRFQDFFLSQHRMQHYGYKIVIGESMEELSRKNEYFSLIHSIHRGMKPDSFHRVSPEDLKTHDRSLYILQQLEDIHKTQNLDDQRVLVYCQPVYNLKTGQYDTAEALMRLMLDDIGLVFPDQFIYLAEANGFIHTLTEIILHKTCEEIRRLSSTGYDITRISVNVSVLELKDDHFCEDISGVIARSGISGDKVAIELTESQSESGFKVMKAKIEELKEKGIKFYLDDFGTGYSNMERIMELPFDIIKFDRSMVQSSSTSERSEKIVSDLASLFDSLNYSVLYEGVETETDENMCREMSASYLQGYKYSRPIPITELKNYAPRKDRAS